MSHSILSTFALFALAVLLAGCTPASKEEPSPEPEPEVVKIPLSSIYSTIGQKEVLLVEPWGKHAYGYDLEQIRRQVQGGASNVFLGKADNIAEAVNATRYALTAGRSADAPVPTELQDARPTSFWLVAYLGIGPSAPAPWEVLAAERKGKLIRLSVFEPKRRIGLMDEHPYLVWVPLGGLEKGKYTLELFDADKKEVTLTRRVAVGAK